MASNERRSSHPHILIRASAGTGKTFQLSNRYIGLLNADAMCDTILASTFTRKAASEILERVILRLAQAALNEKSCRELADFLKVPGLTCERCLDLTYALTRRLHRVRISTFDSFFGKVARSFSLEMGFPPGWRIADTYEDDVLRAEAIRRVLAQHETRDLATLMNLMTKGETTRSVTEVLRSTVNELYDLFQETDAAAWHAIPRSKPLAKETLAGLVESLRYSDIPTKLMQEARDRDVDAALAGDWELFIKRGLGAKVLDGDYEYRRTPIPPDVVAIYERLLAQAKSELVGRVAMQTEATYELLFKFDLVYQQLKRERGALRFDDITRRVAYLVDPAAGGDLANARAGNVGKTARRSDPTQQMFLKFDQEYPQLSREREAPRLSDTKRRGMPAVPAAIATANRFAHRMDGQVQHLLLDEFQDTSPIQWRAIRPMAQRSVYPDQNGTFFCVGDVKQAIYGWRGGVAEIFDAITDEISGVQTELLLHSFRSSPVIIDTVNRVFTGITQHDNLENSEGAVRTWCQGFAKHTTAKADLPGYACLISGPAPSDDSSESESIFDYAAEYIAKLVREAPGWSVGVLVRKNETVGRLIHALRQRHVHASEEGGNPLTDSAAVLLLLSLLQLADHPGDTIARFHIANSPLAAALECANLEEATVGPFAQRVRQTLLDHGYGKTLYDWTRMLVLHCNQRELSRLLQLVDLGYTYQPQATLRTDDFIAYVQKQKVADPSAADVRVMTIHQAKGLEFDIVVLPECDFKLTGQPDTFVVHRDTPTSPVTRVCRYANEETQQLLPAAFQRMFDTSKDRTIAEALCVLYVALTRAVHAMHILVEPSKESEKKLPRTYAGLLRAALVGNGILPAETKAFEQGDPEWFRHCQPKTKPEATPETAAPPVESAIALAPAAERRRRGLERVAPSGLEGGTRVRLADVFEIGSGAALVRGTLIHAWFENLHWMEDGAPNDETLRQIALAHVADLDAHSLKLDEMIQQFQAMLEKPEVAAALRLNSYQSPASLGFDAAVAASLGSALKPDVQHEYNFAVRDANQLVSGSIDRLVLLYSGQTLVAADILDFKTDTLPANDPNALDKKINYYRPQIHAYRAAIGKMTGLPITNILTRLIFVSTGTVRAV